MFYGWWSWRFLSLIMLSSFLDYTIGLKMHQSNEKIFRKRLLYASLAFNLGMLGVFKYFNFFSDSFVDFISLFGFQADAITLNVILPVGISFYTFQTLSYTIDIYKRKLEPTKDIVQFFAFVSFFPQLVAGPIERAKNLLPQFKVNRKFNYEHAVDGCRQILWGFFKKIVIADNCAVFVNEIFGNYTEFSGGILLLGAILFAFQIYGDFSGYSDIAIGTARLFGFNLMQNFAFPYFSRDIAEFWRRWHISLSTWFRDYLYIPLGGSRGGNKMRIRNTFAIFVVSGFWHGANWTFMFWGFLNALFFLPLLLTKQNRNNLDGIAAGRYLPNFKEIRQVLVTFFLTVLAWVFFRAENISSAFEYIQGIFTDIFSITYYTEVFKYATIQIGEVFLLMIGFMLFMEWINRQGEHGLSFTNLKQAWIRIPCYYLILLILVWQGGSSENFIYFQF